MLQARCLALLAIFTLALQTSRASDEIGLIRVGEQWRYAKGYSEPGTNLNWTRQEFEDSAWAFSMGGFCSPTTFAEPTVLHDYGSGYTSLYFRKAFVVTDTNNIVPLILRIDYDDGFIAYLNGREVARRGINGVVNEPAPFNAAAIYHPRGATEEIVLTNWAGLLENGTNMLAVHLLGSGEFDSTFCFVGELLANITRGPFIQNTTPHSTHIVWKTPMVSAGVVEFGVDPLNARRVQVDLAQTNHAARLENLQPDTEYLYRVGNSFGANDTWTEWRTFRTFNESGDIRFNVMGDSGWSTWQQFYIADQMEQSPADLLMHVGDINYYAFTHNNADLRCFSVYHEQMRSTPWFVALGNHDLYVDLNAALLSFYLPTNSVTGTEHYYSFDHGDAHFVVVWSDLERQAQYGPGSPQYEWVKQDLARTTKPWKFMFFHHTWRSSSSHGAYDDYDRNLVADSQQLDESFGALARKYGVQIIFNGHDHCYERLAPSGGPVSFVSGGGGAILYAMIRFHPDSSQFHSRNHFMRVNVKAEEATVEAVGLDGKVFDTVHVRRTFPAREIVESAWNSPRIETQTDTNLNVAGQTFDFSGSPINGPMGLYTSPGRLFVNNDREHLYLGFDEIMLRAGEELFVFLDVPGLAGKESLQGIGDGLVDANGEGADGLDFMSNLSFTNFAPSVGIVLGDEWGDFASRNFLRVGQTVPTGQGAFYLTNGLQAVPGQRLTQFNRSPQDFTAVYEQNSDFVELAIPYSALGGLKPGDIVRIGAITARAWIDTNATAQSRTLDTGAIGYSLETNGGAMRLEGVAVQLAADPDGDGDGLTDAEEIELGTDPDDADTDKDGLPDGWEARFAFNPLSTGQNEAEGDTDNDRFSNVMEFRAGTNPRDAGSRLDLRGAQIEDGVLHLTWSTVAGRRYRLQYRDTLTEPFQNVEDPMFPKIARGSTDSTSVLTRPLDASRARYYRVELVE